MSTEDQIAISRVLRTLLALASFDMSSKSWRKFQTSYPKSLNLSEKPQ